MGICEVRNIEYKQFDKSHDSRFIDQQWKDHSTPGYPANEPDQPVIRITWQEAMGFCKWLSKKTGLKITLPTEAQWEWSNPNYTMDFIPRSPFFSDKAKVVTGVGQYNPNAWGLHDMHGNVVEWTRTTYERYPYSETDGRNNEKPIGMKAARGGSWRDRPKSATSSYRLAYRPWQPVYNVGFRIIAE